jgi:hypothetical protein
MKKEKKVLKFIKNCKCPICGEISIYKFDPTSEDCCIPCTNNRKRIKLEEFRELEKKREEDEFRKKWLRTHSTKLRNHGEKHKVTRIEKPKALLQQSQAKTPILV